MKFNVYYVTQGILLFIFSRYSSYVWLTDGRSLIKTKESRLIIIVCFRMRSITKKAKHRNYSVKVHGGKYKAWYMTTIWKIRYKFAYARINWLTGWCYSPTFSRCCTFNILYRKSHHLFSVFLFNRQYYFLPLFHVACVQICWRRVKRNFFGSFCFGSVKQTDLLSILLLSLYTFMW